MINPPTFDDTKPIKRRPRVRISDGWYQADREGRMIGDQVYVEQWWTPVKWDDEDDPDFHKSAGLSIITGTLG